MKTFSLITALSLCSFGEYGCIYNGGHRKLRLFPCSKVLFKGNVNSACLTESKSLVSRLHVCVSGPECQTVEVQVEKSHCCAPTSQVLWVRSPGSGRSGGRGPTPSPSSSSPSSRRPSPMDLEMVVLKLDPRSLPFPSRSDKWTPLGCSCGYYTSRRPVIFNPTYLAVHGKIVVKFGLLWDCCGPLNVRCHPGGIHDVDFEFDALQMV